MPSIRHMPHHFVTELFIQTRQHHKHLLQSPLQVEKEREALRFEVNKAGAQIKEADAAIAAQKAEIEKLNLIIGEADQVGCSAGNVPSCNRFPENCGGTPQLFGGDIDRQRSSHFKHNEARQQRA